MIADVGWGPPTRSGHVPGSIYLDTDRFEREHDCWKIAGDAELIDLFERSGIAIDVPVRLYGDSPLAVARAAWALAYAGVRDVRVLDGGFAAWAKSGRPIALQDLAG